MKVAWPSWTETARTALCRVASFNRGSNIRLGDERLRVDESLRRYSIPADDGLFRALSENLKPGDVFFDVGANIGLYSLIAARKVSRGGQVVAFEPDPANFALLNKNIALNNLQDVVEPNQIALGDRSDDRGVTFYVPLQGGGSPESSLVAKGKNMQPVTLPLDTIDNVCARKSLRPNLIKIDTEGAEWPIIQGSLEYIRSTKPALIIEYHGGKTKDFGYTVPELWQRIDALGYSQSYVMQGGGDYFMTLCTPV